MNNCIKVTLREALDERSQEEGRWVISVPASLCQSFRLIDSIGLSSNRFRPRWENIDYSKLLLASLKGNK